MFASIPTDKSRFDAELAAFIPDLTHPVRNRNVELLLRSNTPPSKIEEEGLLSIVQRGDAVVTDLDRRIKATQDTLDFWSKKGIKLFRILQMPSHCFIPIANSTRTS